MRQPASWMKPMDDRILEYLTQAGEVTPAVIARNVDISRSYASRRCGDLSSYGLIESTGNAYYRITESGEQYLKGDLNAESLSELGDELDEE